MHVEAEGRRGEVTDLLRAARQEDRAALARAVPLLHDDLRRLAGGQLRRERGVVSLVPGALGVSDRTVRREWGKARAWLHRRLHGAPAH